MSPRPASGERDVWVAIEGATDSTGPSSGYPVETWTSLGGVWMQKVEGEGAEIVEADQLVARQPVTWHMPYRPDMDPDLVDVPKLRRLIYQSRVYDIVDAKPIGRRSVIQLMSRRKVTGP